MNNAKVQYIWAPRFEPIKIDHPIGGIISNIPVFQDNKFKNPKGHTSGYVSWHNEHTSRIIDTCVLSEDPILDGKRTLYIRVKDFIAVLTASQVFEFGRLANYAGATAVKWGTGFGGYPREPWYIHGSPELEIKPLLPHEIRRTSEGNDLSIEIRIGNAVTRVGINAPWHLDGRCGGFLRDDEEYRDLRFKHLDPCNFEKLFRKVLASTWRR